MHGENLRQHTTHLLHHHCSTVIVHEVHRRGPVRRVILRNIASGTCAFRRQRFEGGVQTESCLLSAKKTIIKGVLVNSPLLPVMVCTCGEISPGSTRGSIRPTPVCDRHGMRQKADTLPAHESTLATIACDVFMMAMSCFQRNVL